LLDFGDYIAEGIGMTGRASSRGTYFGTQHNGYGCGNSQWCTTGHNYTSSYALGWKQHRFLTTTKYNGLFFK